MDQTAYWLQGWKYMIWLNKDKRTDRLTHSTLHLLHRVRGYNHRAYIYWISNLSSYYNLCICKVYKHLNDIQSLCQTFKWLSYMQYIVTFLGMCMCVLYFLMGVYFVPSILANEWSLFACIFNRPADTQHIIEITAWQAWMTWTIIVSCLRTPITHVWWAP